MAAGKAEMVSYGTTDSRRAALPGAVTCLAEAGEGLVIEMPGGSAWGRQKAGLF